MQSSLKGSSLFHLQSDGLTPGEKHSVTNTRLRASHYPPEGSNHRCLLPVKPVRARFIFSSLCAIKGHLFACRSCLQLFPTAETTSHYLSAHRFCLLKPAISIEFHLTIAKLIMLVVISVNLK